jgi:exo-beta-1,3-glucanase (GH17 family)
VPDSPASSPSFWADLARAGGPAFVDAVDFVGHNFYIDVFEDPVDFTLVPARVEGVLRDLRQRALRTAGVPPSVPIRVTENGWPTGTNPLTGMTRSEARQAEVIETIVRAVHHLAGALNVSHYMLFGLRDADSAKPDPFHQFGIMRDNYTAKPAYATFKALARELGSP